MTAILMTEDFWRNSQYSVARFYGECRIDGHVYIIVNKEGKDLMQCSIEAEQTGREMAIEPGEPADLVRKDFVKFYRKLGRDKFMAVLMNNRTANESDLKECFKAMIKQHEK